jgi:hypothetical protein
VLGMVVVKGGSSSGCGERERGGGGVTNNIAWSQPGITWPTPTLNSNGTLGGTNIVEGHLKYVRGRTLFGSGFTKSVNVLKFVLL